MDSTKLENLNLTELKEIAKSMDLSINGKKKGEIIDQLISKFTEFENYKKGILQKYKKGEILGKPGKEGTVFNSTYRGREYAMKVFKEKKSVDFLKIEAELLKIGAKAGISPKVKEVNTVFKFIVMDKINQNLFDLLKEWKGELSNHFQTEIVRIVMTLDKIKVFHGDPNPLNFMVGNGETLYIIDYGFGKKIDEKLVKKYGTKEINMKFMILGFILKLREIFKPEIFGKISYPILSKYLSAEDRHRFDIE